MLKIPKKKETLLVLRWNMCVDRLESASVQAWFSELYPLNLNQGICQWFSTPW